MNGEVLPADHGFPARLVVSGWHGAASIKWLGRIQVSDHPLYVPWNTEDYVLIGPDFPAAEPARGPAITALPVSSLVELPWPARLRPEPQMIRGRAFAGENRVERVQYRIDDGPWQDALITSPVTPGVWVRWQFSWTPAPGEPTLRVRATDDQGNTQPDSTSWNERGYLQTSVLAHPVCVESPMRALRSRTVARGRHNQSIGAVQRAERRRRRPARSGVRNPRRAARPRRATRCWGWCSGGAGNEYNPRCAEMPSCHQPGFRYCSAPPSWPWRSWCSPCSSSRGRRGP